MGQLTGQCDVWLDPGLTDKMAQLYKTVPNNWINMNMACILDNITVLTMLNVFNGIVIM